VVFPQLLQVTTEFDVIFTRNLAEEDGKETVNVPVTE